MLPEGLTIEDLLPHRDSMLLINEVVALGEEKTITRCVVSPRWPMTDDRGVPSLILVELAAQTAAISNGWQNHLTHGTPGDLGGWMVGVKKAQFFVDLLSIGTEIIVASKNQFVFEGFREIWAEATVDGQPAAEMILQLMQTETA